MKYISRLTAVSKATIAKLRQRDKATCILVAVCSLLVLLLVLTAELWLPPLLTVAALIAWLVYEVEQRQQDSDCRAEVQKNCTSNERCCILRRCFFEIASDLSSRIHTKALGIEDICVQSVHLRGIRQYQICIPKDPNETCCGDLVQKVIQQRVNARLKAEKVFGANCVSWDDKFPLIVVDEVIDRGLYYDLFVVVDDTREIRDYLLHRLFEHDDVAPIDPPRAQNF